MALIPQDPKQQKALGAALATIVAAVLFNQFWYTGKRAEVDAIQEHYESLESKNNRAELTAVRTQVDRYLRLVDVYRSMGGGWVDVADQQTPKPVGALKQ